MTPWGFGALSGPFGRLDPQQFTPLGLGLVGVCAVYAIAGVWLWHGKEVVGQSRSCGNAGFNKRARAQQEQDSEIERRDVLKLVGGFALGPIPELEGGL